MTKQVTDFYYDGENKVLVALDFGTIRWVVYNLVAGYINKLSDRERVSARGSDRNELRGQMSILHILGAQLLEIAEAVEKGPPDEIAVTLVTE